MDFVKVFDPNEDRVIERREILTHGEIVEIAEEHPDKVILMGEKEKIADIEGFKTAYQKLSSIKKPDETDKGLSDFYFGFIDDVSLDSRDNLYVCFIRTDIWNKNIGDTDINESEIIEAITEPDQNDKDLLRDVVRTLDPVKDKGLVFKSNEYGLKKGPNLYHTYLMDLGIPFSMEFDRYLNKISDHLVN